VIHTVGPVYTDSEDRSELLVSCYRESLRVADELGAQTTFRSVHQSATHRAGEPDTRG
jgi:O-acetyl-ADP-ribose deacetylase (regulator of RNase III)